MNQNSPFLEFCLYRESRYKLFSDLVISDLAVLISDLVISDSSKSFTSTTTDRDITEILVEWMF